MERKRKVELKVRLYPGRDDDLIRWLVQFDKQPYGVKSQAIRDALRRGSGVSEPSDPAAPVVDLGEIRRVVEASVVSALARFEGQVIGFSGGMAVEEDDEAEALLDDLGAALVLGGDGD